MKKVLIVLMIFSFSLYAKEEILINSANAYTITMKNVEIRKKLVDNAKSILIFPSVKKVGFIVGGMHGDGVAIVKNSLPWNVYNAEISNASIGFQIGYEDNFIVIFVMNDESLNKIINNNLKIGVDATASILDASANVGAIDIFNKSIYAYMIKKGAFAGASIGGSVLKINLNKKYNTNYYGYGRLMNDIKEEH